MLFSLFLVRENFHNEKVKNSTICKVPHEGTFRPVSGLAACSHSCRSTDI